MRRRENCFKQNDYGRSEAYQPSDMKVSTSLIINSNTFGKASDFKYGLNTSTALTFKGKEDAMSFKASNPEFGASSRPALEERKDFSNLGNKQVSKNELDGYKYISDTSKLKGGVESNKNRCAWNKFTYGANQGDIPKNKSGCGQRPDFQKHTYGAGNIGASSTNISTQKRERFKVNRDREDLKNKNAPTKLSTTPTGSHLNRELSTNFRGETHKYDRNSLNRSKTPKVAQTQDKQGNKLSKEINESKFTYQKHENRALTKKTSYENEKNAIEALKKKPKEELTALERSKLRMDALKSKPLISSKKRDDEFKREVNYITRRANHNEKYDASPRNYTPTNYYHQEPQTYTPSYIPQSDNLQHLQNADPNLNMYELVKKYNPGIRKEAIQSHLNMASEVSNMFRKGSRRRHNYGYVGDLSKRFKADKAARERQNPLEQTKQRLNYIKRENEPLGGQFSRRYERAIPSQGNLPRSYTPSGENINIPTRHAERQTQNTENRPSYDRNTATPTRNTWNERHTQRPTTSTTPIRHTRNERKPEEQRRFERKTVGNVTARCDHINRSRSPMTRLTSNDEAPIRNTKPGDFTVRASLDKTTKISQNIPATSFDRTFKRNYVQNKGEGDRSASKNTHRVRIYPFLSID